MTWLFVHGWGFDGRFWELLLASLGGPATVVDRGYFGEPSHPYVEGDVVVVAHSMGLLTTLASLPTQPLALVAINSFDRFTRTDGYPGVDARSLENLIRQTRRDPVTALTRFRSGLGEDAPLPGEPTVRLLHDLERLRDMDARDRLGDMPILCLEGDRDPLLSAEHRASSFNGATRLTRRTVPGQGHLLPLTAPGWCAEAISSFVRSLDAV